MSRPKSNQSLDARVLRRLRARDGGAVTTASDLLDMGTRAAVDQALSRLVRRGVLRRVGRGVYAYPQQSRLLGELSPDPDEVAKALARQGAQRLIPSGAYAANLLGLTEQVPGRVEYLTDGPGRRATIGRLDVVLRRTTPRQLAAGRVTGLVIQALKFLRREQVDAAVVETLRQRLSEADRRQLIKDIRLAPVWMGEVFRQVAGERP